MPVKRRGDTIVEVMVAFTIFAMAAVAAVTIMNRGIAIAQRSLEVTLVRQQIDSQADMLRYVRDNNTSAWSDIKNANFTAPQTSPPTACPRNTDEVPVGTFYLQSTPSAVEHVSLRGGNANSFSLASTYAKLNDSRRLSEGLWVQPVRVDATTYDMYINACWDTVGSDMPLTLRTIVRLYES